MCKFHNSYAHKAHRCTPPVFGRKSSLPPSHFRFGGQSNTRHGHSYAFPRKCWIDLTNNNRYLVDTGATLSFVPCNQNATPSGPLLKEADEQPIPSWGFIKKTLQFQGKLFTATFLQAAVAGPILGIDFLKKFKVTVSPEINLIQFACSAAASPAHHFAFSGYARPPIIFRGLLCLAFFI